MSEDEKFHTGDSGASLTIPMSAGSLKKGHFVCINDKPCKIIEITTSKTGKHGHAKANITGVDVFTGKKYEEVSPTSHSLPSPIVKRTEYALLDIANDGTLTLMDDANNTREDLSLPADEDVAGPIKAGFEDGKDVTVAVMSAMGMEQVLGFKM